MRKVCLSLLTQSTVPIRFAGTSPLIPRHGPCKTFRHALLSSQASVVSAGGPYLDEPSGRHDKDIEILLLRQQLRILQRKHPQPPRISRWEKLTLVVLAGKLTNRARARLGQVVLLFKPDTVLKWRRDLVRRKWTFKRQVARGRPAISTELEALILRLAKENPAWGYGKLEGELSKLGYDIGRSTIRDVLKRNHVPPAPERASHGSSWRTFLSHHKHEILACDFFTVETAWLKTVYILFFIELGSRRVHLAGCTTNPTSAWVTQQARQLHLEDPGWHAPRALPDPRP